MFKRPGVRSQRNAPAPPFVRPTKGVVSDIINRPKYCPAKPRPFVAHENVDEFLYNLEKNYAYHGLTFRSPRNVVNTVDVRVRLNVLKNGTVRVDLEPRYRDTPPVEKHIEYLDDVQVHLSVLKTGKVRVKCVLHGAQLYEKYYAKAKSPPIKAIVSAYKHLGYSEAFVESFKDKHAGRLVYAKKVGQILEAIFDKSVHARPKKKAVAEKVPEEDSEDDESEDEDGPEEDEAIVADDEEPEDEEPEEILEDLDE